jgi:hypothetical protein
MSLAEKMSFGYWFIAGTFAVANVVVSRGDRLKGAIFGLIGGAIWPVMLVVAIKIELERNRDNRKIRRTQ